MKKKFLLMMMLSLLFTAMGTSVLNAQNVAKVGNTEYTTIDEAIANWTNGTTLTLLANVTLSDVIELSSTEYHILDLGSCIMTAASKKDAIQIVNNGRSSASYALDIKADATNPGGITASGKAVVRTTGKSGVKDRPIIRFYNGVFNGSYIVYHSGSNGTNCPQFCFYGGVFDGTIYTNRTLNQFYGGIFKGSLMMSVDSSAYTLIAGGTFKQLSNLYMSALNSSKFTIGSAKGVYDKEVYIDDNGNYVIAATDPSQGIQADVAKNPGTNDYLAYSKVATDGQLGYTDVKKALNDNKSGVVTVYVEEIDMEGIDFEGTIVVPEGKTVKITNAPADLKTEGTVVIVKPVAKIGTQEYMTLEEAFTAATEGQTITLLADATPALTSQRAITKASVIDLGGKTLTLTEDDLYFGTTTFQNGNIVVDPSVKPSTAVFWMFANQTLTFDNVKLTATGVTGTYLIGLDGNNSDLNIINGSEIIIENTTALDLDVICVNASTGNDIVVEDSKVNVTNLDGRVFFRGNYTIKGESDINLAGITKAGFRIEAGQTLSVEDTSTIDIEGEPRDGGIHLTDLTATYTVAETATVNATVNEPVAVAQIGTTKYGTLADALAAASAMAGDVTVEIYEKVTLNQPLAGSYSSIKFLAKDTDAEIYLDVEGYITATGKEVAFEGLTLSKSQGGYITNAGFMNVAFGVYDVTKVTYTSCTFDNGAYASSGNVTYTGCTFKRSHDKYGLWAYGDVDVTVDDCTFADYRGIKMYAEGAAKTVDLTVKGTDFSAVTDKPAIVLTYGEKVTLQGNTYSETGTFELDLDGAPNGTTVTSDVDPICINDNGACGVLVNDKIYTTVAQAAEVATSGSTVTLLHNSTETVELPVGVTLDKNGYTAENVTIAEPFADHIVLPSPLDENNYKTMFGVNTVTDGTNYYPTLQAAVEAVAGQANAILYCKPGADVGSLQHAPVTSTLTVYGNDASVSGNTERDFDLGNTDPSGGNDITADMTLTVKHLDGCGAWGAKATEHTVNLVFENCDNMGKVFITGTTGTLNITMTDCAFEGVIKEAVYSNADGAITLTKVAFSNLNKAVNLNHKAAGTQTVTIDECTFTNCGANVADDQIPVRVLSSVEGGKTILSVENTTFTGTPEGGADILLANGVGLTDATIKTTAAKVQEGSSKEIESITVEDEYKYINAVAQIGETYYTSLQAAINAVKDGETITLVDNVTISAATAGYTDGTYTDGVRYTGDKSFTVDFNGKTVTDDGCVNDYLIYINNKGEKASEITFTNGTIVSKNGCWSAVCVNSSPATQNVVLNLNGMNITNSNDAEYSGNPVVRVRDLATVNVNDGTIITSNGASYGVAASTDGSTLNINEGATIVQKNSGTTAGNSVFAAVGGKGVINIKGGTITSDKFGVHTMTTGTPVINISGGTITAPVALKSSTNGGNGELATINVTGGTINGTLETYTENGKIVVSGGTFSEAVAQEYCAEGYVPVENADGTFGVELAPVASINGTEYTSLAEAVAAAQAGDEIVLIADVKTTDGVVITDKNLTIDLNGKTYTVTEGASTNNRNFKINGTSVVTVKNGTMVAAGEYSSGAYGTIRTEGTANVTLTGLKLYNYRGNGLNIKACSGTTVTIENTEIYANYGGGIESAGGTIVVDNVTVEQKGMYTAPYNSMAISVNGGGKVTVNSGTYSTECITAEEANNQGTSHGPWVAGVLNSGGTLIINGGTFSNDNFGENSLATYARGAILADTKAKVEINGGTFNVLKNVIDIQNNLGDTNNNPSVLLAGGTYSADPTISAQYGSNLITLAEDYVAVKNNGVWNVVKAAAKIGEQKFATLEAAVNAAQDGEEIDLLKDVELTSPLLLTKNNILDGNGFKLTPAEGFTPDGNGAVIALAANMSGYDANRTYTVKNLTIEGFSTPSRIVRANFCNATIQNCIFDDNASASIITSAYAVLNVAGNTFTNNTTSYAVINVGSDVSDGTALVAEITGNKFYNNEAAIAGIFLASSANVTNNHFNANTHTGANANAAAILAGPYTGNMAYTVNIKSNAFENAMSKGGTALPSVFAEDWSSLGSTTSFDLSLNYWDGNEPVAGKAYKTGGDNPQVTVKSYYKTYTDGTLGGLIEYPQGNNFNGYTRTDAIWGEVWGNAKESFIVKVLDANDNVMGTTSLNNIGGIINGNVNVTWTLKLDAASNTDEYWTMEWTTAPTINNMPAKVELWVDGVKVSGGPVVLNGPDEIAKIYAAVTNASGKILGYYTDIQEAIKAAAAVDGARATTAGTVEFLADVTVDKWIMFAEKLTIGDGSLITLNINGVTIDGNGKALTVKSIESASNGGYLFYDAQNLTVKDLTINIADGLVGGIGLQQGTISNVTFNGGQYGVLPGANGVTIDGCTFNGTTGYAVYYESEKENIVVSNNTFNTADGAYAITMRSNEQFTDNIITKGRVNLANSAASTVSGNDFGTERFKVYNAATATISDNIINNLVFNETNVPTESTFTDDNTLSAEAQAAIDALPIIAGEGTEANPYTISNLARLKAFRDDVNAGNKYQGKYVKLTADIDLNNEEWTPIGNNTNKFQGYFDGNEKTISNLKISGNNKYVGLFGYILGQGMSASTTPSVKDLTLENVNVSGDYYVGGLAGQAYTCNITNVTVKGNVSGVRYVGGLVGHVYTYFKYCHFIGNASCSFDALGGIAGAGDCRAYDCSVIGDVTGSNWVGGIVGNGQEGTSAVGCYVKGDVKTSTNYYFGVGGIAGVAGHGYSSSEFKNNYFDGEVYLEEEIVPAMIIGIVNADNNETINATIEGNSWNTEYYDAETPVYVTAEAPKNGTTEDWIAGASEELTKPRNNNLVMLKSDIPYVEATDINDVTIMKFSEVTEDDILPQIEENNQVAYIDSNADGAYNEGETKYTSLADAYTAATVGQTITLLKNITLSEKFVIERSIILDGNDKTLTYTGTDRAIDVPNDENANIDVTVKKLTVEATNANRGLNYNENGKFNVEGVTVTIGENVDGYAINFPGMADNAQVTIKDSKLTSRNPLNIWGENMVINVYDSEIVSVDNNSTYDYAAIQLNNDNYGNVANGTVVNVYRGTITALNDNDEPSNVVANATETGVVNISDETIVTGKVLNYVANIGGVYFGSLQAAVNAIEKYGYNSPIVIMKSFATSETATVKNGLNVTINLNGKTITGTDTTSVNFSIIDNRGNLTITDNTVSKEGKITLTATIDSDWNRYSAVIANNPGGKLTIEAGTLEHLGGTDMAYGIDNLTNGKGTYAETVINGGHIKSTYRGIRQFLNGTEAQNILTVNGGTIEGANKSIWMQDPNKNANTGTLTVGENAQLKGDVYLYVTPNSTSWPVEVSIAAEALQGESTVMTANLPVGVDVQNINGTYGVVNVVAQIGDVKYQSLADAATAAQSGETIQLIWAEGNDPISMAATFVGDKTVTITGTADVDWSKGWFFVGRGGEGDGHVIFDNANLTSTSVGSNSGLGLNVSCKKEGESTTNDGEVEIINSNIQLDYLIGKGNIKLDNSKLEVYEGFAVGARPASETGGVQRTVTMDITNGSNVIVDNHNGQGLGHESNGIMNIDATSTFETKRSFLITANGTMNNAGTVTINGTLTNNGTINLTDVALTGMTIDGTGTTYFYNTVNFYGNNNITTNINGAPFELIVNEDATLLISRFVLGYDRAITVYGNIEDAHNLTAEQVASMTPSLKFNSTSGVSVGGTATGRLTAKDAYLEFGNSSWKNSYAEHTWSFENCYVSATSFGNNNEPGAVTSTWNVTFDNSVLAAKNYIKNGKGVTYNFTNGSVATTGSLRIDGTLNVDANSSVTTTGQQNNVQNAVDEHGGINGTINIDGTLTIGSNSATQLEVLDGEVNVTETGNIILLDNNTLTLDADSEMRSCGNITGAITAAEGADVEITGGTYTQDVDEWCHEYYDAIPNGDGTWTVEQVMYALVRDLQEGWSWFSSFINIDGEAGLTKIKDALGENGVQVKDAYSGRFIQYTSASGWNGTLNEASSQAVYSIKTINDGDDIPEISVKDFTIKGAKVDPSLPENTVYINKGWNYIAYPLDQVAGLDVLSFTPAVNDVIKSKEISSIYFAEGWFPNIDMIPGEGYMYKSNDNATKSFNFAYPTRSAVDASISNNVTNDYYWSVNAHKYPSNMTIVAMLNIDNELVKDSYEIAAFANGECRGRAQSVYVESLDTYVLVLTVHGEDVENITFKYYDVNSGAEYELSNMMVYSNDAIVGSVDEPYMFNLDILNVEEASINDVNVYPNPTTTNAEIDLNATCDKVEVFNALGVKVAEYSNVDSIDALETAGVYVIRVTIDGNVRNCRLVVK